MSTFIKKCREEAGLTQAQLAEKMDVSVVAVQNWERGKTKVNLDRYMDLAAVFNVPVDRLIKEVLIEQDKACKDRWPDFLFDKETNDIVNTLHLNLAQQNLFGLLYIYGAEYLEKTRIDVDDFKEDLKRIPYGFIDKVGSIQFMNQAEGLHKVIKYVRTDFLMKVLRQNPEAEFNIRKLSKNLICEFIDCGYKRADMSSEFEEGYEGEKQLYFHICMCKAEKLLPVLEEQGPVHLTDGWWSRPVRDDISEKLLSEYLKYCKYNPELFKEGYYKKEYNAMRMITGLEAVTDYKNVASGGEEEKWMWSINEKGRKLLKWFRE